jgi:hypothetical protein
VRVRFHAKVQDCTDSRLPITQYEGEDGTGFEKAGSLGPFNCGNCKHFSTDKDSGTCNQPEMMKLSKQPRSDDGKVLVAAEDCCEFVERAGKTQDE